MDRRTFSGSFASKPATFSPSKERKNTKITSNREATGTGDEDSETEMEGPTLRMADLKFQNFPDNVPCDGT